MNTPFTKTALVLAFVLPVVAGCPSGPPEEPPANSAQPGPQRTLHVLVIGDDNLAEGIERQWRARSDTAIELHRSSAAGVRAAGGESLGADVVVFPSGLLGEFAEQDRIVPLGKRVLESENFNQQDVFELLRRGETTWGKKSFAVSLGSPQLTLMYRQDLFQALNLTPPTTWSAYQQLVDRLAKRDELGDHTPPVDGPWYAAREPLGDGWAGQLLLARAAAYVRHPHQYSTLFDLRNMRPLIDGAPFVKALEELVKAAPSEAEARATTPAQVRSDFLSGRCAMAFTWPSHADSADGGQPAGEPMQVGFAQLPGSSDVFNFRSQLWEPRAAGAVTTVPLLASAGRLAALTRRGRRSSAANTMLLWLGGSELGNIVCPTSKSTTLFRTSQIAGARRWVNPQLGDRSAAEYGELLRRTQDQSIWLSSVRIPARPEYLAALDQAVQRALDGEPAEKALAEAATKWQQITDELGRDKQQAAYTRSIGLEP
jgi:multiple sugar transport system substrate-binding protein